MVVEQHLPFGVEGIGSCDGADADELEDGLADDQIRDSIVVIVKEADRIMRPGMAGSVGGEIGP